MNLEADLALTRSQSCTWERYMVRSYASAVPSRQQVCHSASCSLPEVQLRTTRAFPKCNLGTSRITNWGNGERAGRREKDTGRLSETRGGVPRPAAYGPYPALFSSSALSTHMTKNGCAASRRFMYSRNGLLKTRSFGGPHAACTNTSDSKSAPLRSS